MVSLPIQKGKQIQNAQTGWDVPIDLGLHLARGGSRERRQIAVRVGADLTFGRVDVLFAIAG